MCIRDRVWFDTWEMWVCIERIKVYELVAVCQVSVTKLQLMRMSSKEILGIVYGWLHVQHESLDHCVE